MGVASTELQHIKTQHFNDLQNARRLFSTFLYSQLLDWQDPIVLVLLLRLDPALHEWNATIPVEGITGT
ncbi:hypothetical protein Tco_0320743 [Tanacetum coccineum]